ncbi:hypothetical protein ACVMIH_000610 [Bradyrhizobium sp. USDA 4503]
MHAVVLHAPQFSRNLLAKRSSHRKATVVVARKLAVIMHAMWTSGTFYCGDPDAAKADVSARAAVKERRLLAPPA